MNVLIVVLVFLALFVIESWRQRRAEEVEEEVPAPPLVSKVVKEEEPICVCVEESEPAVCVSKARRGRVVPRGRMLLLSHEVLSLPLSLRGPAGREGCQAQPFERR